MRNPTFSAPVHRRTKRYRPAVTGLRLVLIATTVVSACSGDRTVGSAADAATAVLVDRSSPLALASIAAAELAALDSTIVSTLLESVPPEMRARERRGLVPPPGVMVIPSGPPSREHEPLLLALANVRREEQARMAGRTRESESSQVRVRVVLSPSLEGEGTIATIVRTPRDSEAKVMLLLRASDAGPRELEMGLLMAARVEATNADSTNGRRLHFTRHLGVPQVTRPARTAIVSLFETISQAPERDLPGFGRVRSLDVFTTRQITRAP